MRSRHFALIAAAATILLAGCERSEQYPRWNRSREQRLLLFAEVEKLAVVQCRDLSRAEWPEGLGPDQYAKLFADEIARRARFKVIYPHEVMTKVEQANRDMLEQLRRDKRSLKPEDVIDIGRSEDDAAAAGQVVGADAVLVITIDDFDPYPPKRIGLTARVYLCRAAAPAGLEIIQQSDAGVPLEITGALREKFIWERQKYYDTRRKNTQEGLDWFARKHTDFAGYGGERGYYVTENFLGFVAYDLTDLLYDDAQWYKSHKPREPRDILAPRNGLPGEPEGRSGYDLGHGEHGTNRTRQ